MVWRLAFPPHPPGNRNRRLTRIDDLPEGRWSIKAYAPDGATGESIVDVQKNSISDVDYSGRQ